MPWSKNEHLPSKKPVLRITFPASLQRAPVTVQLIVTPQVRTFIGPDTAQRVCAEIEATTEKPARDYRRRLRHVNGSAACSAHQKIPVKGIGMPRTTVHIEEKAFMTMFLASAEAYPSRFRHDMHRRPNGTLPEGEAYGLLFGQKIFKDDDEIFNVTLAVPSQIVMNRDADGIEVHGVHFYRILELAEIFPAYQFLGTYHSHPYLEGDFNKKDSVVPSGSDRQTSLETADEVEKNIIDVIVGMTCLQEKTRMHPEFVASNIIHHCFSDYLYSIGCNWSNFTTKVFAPVDKLLCPTAFGVHYLDSGENEKFRHGDPLHSYLH